MQYITTSEGKAVFLDLDQQTCYKMQFISKKGFKKINK